MPPSNPNIVLLHSHDTGRYISPYGYDVPTPNLHTLAEEALVFRNAFTPAPTCSPSRVAMMTGMVPHTAGMLGNTGHGWAMDDPDQHLANHLRKHGYDTVLCGFQDEQPGDNDPAKSRELGYRTFPDPNAAYDDEATAAAATEYLASADEPFFLHTTFVNTHRGYPDPEETGIDPDGVNPPGPLPDVPVCRRGWAGFHGSVRALDACAGTVIDALREHNMLGNTVLLFTTDHGPPFKDMKCNLYDGGTRVSLLARFPEGPRGDTTDAFVSHEDLVPTLCEYLDVGVPSHVQGRSWLPAVTGRPFDGREMVYGEVTYHGAYEPKRCVRTRRYKYIRRYGDCDTYVLPNVDPSPSKSFFVEHGLGDRKRPREALYDTYFDPSERHNLIDDPVYEDVRTDLRSALDDWMERTDDPLLSGPVSKPQGVRSTLQDAVDNGDESEPKDVR